MSPRTAHTPTVAETLAQHRADAGLSYFSLAVEISRLLPAQFRPSPEKLRRYESGMVPDGEMDPVVLGALAHVFRVPLDDLSPAAADSMRLISRLWCIDPVAA